MAQKTVNRFYRYKVDGSLHMLLQQPVNVDEDDVNVVTLQTNALSGMAQTHSWMGPASEFNDQFEYVKSI